VVVAAVDVADEDLTKTTTITMATVAATRSDDGSNDDNGGNDNDETTRPTSTAWKGRHNIDAACRRWSGNDGGGEIAETGTMFGGGWGGWQQGERAAEAATAGWLWVYLPFF
jgi:hypothetical protein